MGWAHFYSKTECFHRVLFLLLLLLYFTFGCQLRLFCFDFIRISLSTSRTDHLFISYLCVCMFLSSLCRVYLNKRKERVFAMWWFCCPVSCPRGKVRTTTAATITTKIQEKTTTSRCNPDDNKKFSLFLLILVSSWWHSFSSHSTPMFLFSFLSLLVHDHCYIVVVFTSKKKKELFCNDMMIQTEKQSIKNRRRLTVHLSMFICHPTLWIVL